MPPTVWRSARSGNIVYNPRSMNDIYTYTVPIFTKLLKGLKQCIEKAEAHGLDEVVLMQDKLAPDMFPFVRQVQIACDNAKGATARLAGMDVPSKEDNEKTLAELKARIDWTLTFIASVSESSFDGAHDRKIELPYFPGKYMTGFDYVREYVLPNFMFHTVTAYGLIRKNGVAIGKADYVFGLPLKDL